MTTTMAVPTVFVAWPSAPLTDTLVRRSLAAVCLPFALTSTTPTHYARLVQWSAYDVIAHELAHDDPANVLVSSYTIRKVLIRKHFLSRCLQSYTVKHPDSILSSAIPRTWDIDISFADDLDEMWADDLWDLGVELDSTAKWWILKPGMADRGNGIRLFDSKDALRRIFNGFEKGYDDDDGEESDGTAVITSQLRHFVLQEYLSNPMLIDPSQIPRNGSVLPPDCSGGHKFHLRAYCVVSGALKVYMCTRILALFSSVPYSPPINTDTDTLDLRPHLTNTSLQTHRGEEGVFLFDELHGCTVLSPQDAEGQIKFGEKDAANILDQMCEILADTFRAAMEHPVHFQPLPNAFELFGVDFLLTTRPITALPSSGKALAFMANLLEINAEPAIELTGPRLTWVLEDLFEAIGKVCVEPFLINGLERDAAGDHWPVGETRYSLRKCLEMETKL